MHHELHAYSLSCRPEINERELEGKESTRMCGTRKSFYSFYFVSLYKIIYLDAVEHRYIEEVGAANFFCVKDGVVYTPELTGTILPGTVSYTHLRAHET